MSFLATLEASQTSWEACKHRDTRKSVRLVCLL